MGARLVTPVVPPTGGAPTLAAQPDPVAVVLSRSGNLPDDIDLEADAAEYLIGGGRADARFEEVEAGARFGRERDLAVERAHFIERQPFLAGAAFLAKKWL